MPKRVGLEDKLDQIRSELEKASQSFEESVQTLAGLLGSQDTARISAAKDAMHMWSDAIRTLTEEERAIQRRLDYQTSTELSHSALKAVKSASRAAWATFWIAVIAILASHASAMRPAVTFVAQLVRQ